MPAPIVSTVLARQADDDGALVQRILRHDHAAFELLMRRDNAKLYPVARSILKNDADVDDVLQEAHLAAYRGLDRFQGAAQLSTWLTRIVQRPVVSCSRSGWPWRCSVLRRFSCWATMCALAVHRLSTLS